MRSKTTTAELMAEQCGNDLAVRLTARVAKAACLTAGRPVIVEVVEGAIFIRIARKPKLSLTQKLRVFETSKHGGEALTIGRIGNEIF